MNHALSEITMYVRLNLLWSAQLMFGSAHEKIVLPSAEDMRASGGSNASSTEAWRLSL